MTAQVLGQVSRRQVASARVGCQAFAEQVRESQADLGITPAQMHPCVLPGRRQPAAQRFVEHQAKGINV